MLDLIAHPARPHVTAHRSSDEAAVAMAADITPLTSLGDMPDTEADDDAALATSLTQSPIQHYPHMLMSDEGEGLYSDAFDQLQGYGPSDEYQLDSYTEFETESFASQMSERDTDGR